MAFYKICVGVSLQQIAAAWPLVLYPSVFSGIGFVLGNILTRLLRIESKALRHSITLTLMFGNYGSLPFSILQTITKDVSPFAEDPLSMQRSLAYTSIFMSTASLWLWSFGPWYINRGRETPMETAEVPEIEDQTDDSKPEDLDENTTELDDLNPAQSSNERLSAPSEIELQAFQPRLPFRQRVVARLKAIFTIIKNLPIWSTFLAFWPLVEFFSRAIYLT